MDSVNSTTPTNDEGLRCPECEYNLTGLVEDVCPECGRPFDREQLLAELAGATVPIPIWSQRDEIGDVRAFGRTVLEIWAHPTRFAKRFPQNPDCDDAVLFSRWCLGIAMGVWLIPLAFLLFVDASSSSGGLVSWAGLILGVFICEWLIAAVVFVPRFKVTTAGKPKPWYPQSLALVRMTRAYLLLSTATLCACWATGLFLHWSGDFLSITSYVMLAIAVYWWVSMALIASTYRKSTINLVLGMVTIPVCVWVSVMVSTVLFGILVSAVVKL
ncbi:MAG: hypothetical protein DHS20C16_29200 [Phycisphaerae bacterium]|nr:MAG: hypothetical protein DHS20C16_29200 [Phycisphaerae bacterium]